MSRRRAVAGEYVTTPEAHGWDTGGFTVAQKTAAFQAAIEAASTNASKSGTGRGVVELTPSKLYEVFSTPGAESDPNGCLMLDSAAQANVEIRTQGRPTGATRATIKTHESVDDAFGANQFGSLCTIEIQGSASTNIWLTHLIVDGNKFLLVGQAGEDKVDYAQYGDNGGLHAIGIDGAVNVHLEWLEVKNGWTDGLRIKAHTPGGGPSASRAHTITVVDCDFHHNRRLAVGIIDCGLTTATWDQVVFTRCKFRDTADEGTTSGGLWPFTTAGYPGQRPGAGFDMEPNNQSQSINGVTIQDCTFDGNGPCSWDNGPDTTGNVRHLSVDTGSVSSVGSVNRYLKILNNSFINSGSVFDEIGIVLRQDGTVDNFALLEHAIIEGNVHTTGRYWCEGFPDQTPDRSKMVDVTFNNNVINDIMFQRLAPTGNSVTGNGNTKPAGGATTITNTGSLATIAIT